MTVFSPIPLQWKVPVWPIKRNYLFLETKHRWALCYGRQFKLRRWVTVYWEIFVWGQLYCLLKHTALGWLLWLNVHIHKQVCASTLVRKTYVTCGWRWGYVSLFQTMGLTWRLLDFPVNESKPVSLTQPGCVLAAYHQNYFVLPLMTRCKVNPLLFIKRNQNF